jgi:hypothetical protein
MITIRRVTRIAAIIFAMAATYLLSFAIGFHRLSRSMWGHNYVIYQVTSATLLLLALTTALFLLERKQRALTKQLVYSGACCGLLAGLLAYFCVLLTMTDPAARSIYALKRPLDFLQVWFLGAFISGTWVLGGVVGFLTSVILKWWSAAAWPSPKC